jgi:hypothetical protein
LRYNYGEYAVEGKRQHAIGFRILRRIAPQSQRSMSPLRSTCLCRSGIPHGNDVTAYARRGRCLPEVAGAQPFGGTPHSRCGASRLNEESCAFASLEKKIIKRVGFAREEGEYNHCSSMEFGVQPNELAPRWLFDVIFNVRDACLMRAQFLMREI